MALKIEISGFDKDFLPVFESLAKSLKATYRLVEFETLQEQKENSIKKALQELKNGEYESYKDFKAYQKAMREI